MSPRSSRPAKRDIYCIVNEDLVVMDTFDDRLSELYPKQRKRAQKVQEEIERIKKTRNHLLLAGIPQDHPDGSFESFPAREDTGIVYLLGAWTEGDVTRVAQELERRQYQVKLYEPGCLPECVYNWNYPMNGPALGLYEINQLVDDRLRQLAELKAKPKTA